MYAKFYLIYLISTHAFAHSWVERLMVFGSSGQMVGKPGYPRGTVSRMAPSFTDFDMQYLLPHGLDEKVQSSERICKETQLIGNYSATFPMLQSPQGAFVALQYQENGHVTLPLPKEKHSSGLVYIYATLQPSNNDRLLAIHKVWNKDGTGGDRRGWLLGIRPFDDGQCHQINNGTISKQRQQLYRKLAREPWGADLWCQNDVRLPWGISGPLTLYWVWDWPVVPNPNAPRGKDEFYTTCIDIDILPQFADNITFKEGLDFNVAGIKKQLLG